MAKQNVDVQAEVHLTRDELDTAIREYLVKHKNFKPTHVGLVLDDRGVVTGARGIFDGRKGYGYLEKGGVGK